jgi:transposase
VNCQDSQSCVALDPHQAPLAPPRSSPPATQYEPRRAANRARRKARYDEVLALHAQGLSQKAIAVRLNLTTKTIRRWLRAGSFPERAPQHRQRTLLAPFEAYLKERWSAGCHNGAQLWRELCQQGYTGSRTLVSEWVAQQRRGILMPVSQTVANPPLASPAALTLRTRSVRQTSWLLMRHQSLLTTEEQAYLDRLFQGSPAIDAAYRFAQDFRQIAHERNPETLDAWLAAVAASDLPDLQRFAVGLKRDQAAVHAAFSLPWSNGPVEGHVNRVKFIKRQGYGRAGFDLLKHRVLSG